MARILDRAEPSNAVERWLDTGRQTWKQYCLSMLLFNAAVHKPMPRDDNERQPDWLTFVSMRDSRSKTRATAFLVKAPFSDFELRSLV